MDQHEISHLNGINHGGANGEERGLMGPYSEEEKKIRNELEAEIEKNLEEEIKDGIYHLALKLHRLYQQRKERETSDGSGLGPKNKTVTEVNISIKMEGAMKIEIKETKTDGNYNRDSQAHTKNPENSGKIMAPDKVRKERMKNHARVREIGWKW